TKGVHPPTRAATINSGRWFPAQWLLLPLLCWQATAAGADGYRSMPITSATRFSACAMDAGRTNRIRNRKAIAARTVRPPTNLRHFIKNGLGRIASTDDLTLLPRSRRKGGVFLSESEVLRT